MEESIDETRENPMVNPCKCDGTMKYIHALCLKEWLKSGRTTKENGLSVSYTWKSFDCELCKTTYDSSMIINGKKFVLAEIHWPETEYMILESLNTSAHKQIHVISLELYNEFKIGRGHDCDIRVTDISVSRAHAILRRNAKKEFFIEDFNSKFGTLIQMWHPYLLTKEPIELQQGRSIMKISLVEPEWSRCWF